MIFDMSHPSIDSQGYYPKKQPPQEPRFASGVSDAADAIVAVDQVLSAVTRKMVRPVDLMMVFATADHRHTIESIFRRLNDALSPKVSLGTTAMGVIGSGREIEHSPGLSVLTAELPGATLRPYGYNQTDWESATDSPDAMDETINVGPDLPKAVIIFADPFSTPIVSLLPMMNRHWSGVPIIGGMCSGGTKPMENMLIVNGKIHHEGAVGVTISGNIDVDCVISQGCRGIGKPYVITKSKRHIVYELGGHNPLEVIEDLVHNLDQMDCELIESRGLMIGRVINEYQDRFGRGDFLIRHLLAVDHETGAMAVNDPQIRVGQTIQFHVHDQKTAIEDFKLLLEGQKLHGPGAGAMLFSCNGRGRTLFDQPNTDALLVNEALKEIPLAGFFAAGEIGPVGGENFLHGHTASLIVFRGTKHASA